MHPSDETAHHVLPTELWLEVFSHLDARSYAISHAPFQPVPGIAAEGKICRDYLSLILVCRQWRAWAMELLYRNFKLSDANPSEPKLPLEYGPWVRRAVVPYTSTPTETFKPMPSTEILGRCSNLEVLVRPPLARSLFGGPRFEFDATCPSLSKLRRLDWWYHAEASRSGGINSLAAVLALAPNIEYLFVGGATNSFAVAFYRLDNNPIYLPRLRTLRINIANAVLLRHIMYHWAVPVLENLVLDVPFATDLLWEALGPRLTGVEFGKHVQFLAEDHLGACLRGCPAVRELNYHILITAPPVLNADVDVFPALESLGVHLTDVPRLEDEAEEWASLARHFDAFCTDAFPNLRTLKLFGLTKGMAAHPRFVEIKKRVQAKGCMVIDLGA
ncbi:hypothetical protein MKEN_01257200 [Mycena kentingensis (nom. inval.)]|nr:hypothetical protein MKEN_01257200 [Mycena kentingensis (nom. inval.)]